MPNFVPNSYIIQILVTGGQPVVSLYEGDSTKLKGDNLHVNVGDRIAWRVMVQLVGGRAFPGFTIGFADAAFFGKASIAVPASPRGSASEFLEVRSTNGANAYTLTVDGVGCVFDPEIQSGGGGTIIMDARSERAALASSDFVVTWDTTVNPTVMTYRKKDGTSAEPSPMPVNCGDKVTFLAVTAGAGAVTGFTITFPPFPPYTNCWQNPFDNTPALTANPATPKAIGQEVVSDNANDLNVTFPFNATINVDGATINSDPAKSYSIKLLSVCP